MVFYRKYRPQTLDELVGQLPVKQVLKSALLSGKLSHAYLFCGPRGTGKTSTARILAKIVNCEGQESSRKSQGEDEQSKFSTLTVNPCNKCPTCLSITNGSNLDVIEMDAASNRGIDDIRSLRENIKLSPSGAKKKVYIIDEAHMLSGEAFNALLKTLEEPPSHVLFILATTEIQKIPQTILSRVSKLDFKQAATEELLEALKKIAVSEKMNINNEALLLLAKKAQGSFRDGIKFLDLLSGFDKIDQQTVEENLGTGVFEAIILLLEDMANLKAAEALKKLAREAERGASIKELNLFILDILRQLLLIKHGLGEALVKPEIGGEKLALLESLAVKFDLDKLLFTLDCFQKSLEQSRFVSLPTLPLEIAIVESCQSSVLGYRLSDSGQPVAGLPAGGSGTSEHQPKADCPLELKTDNRSTNDQTPDIQKLLEKWDYVLETVRAYNFSLEALLRSSKILECGEKSVVIEVPYSFHQRILEAPKSRDLLESVLSDVLERSIKISTALGQRPVRREDLANVEVAADDEIVRIAAEIFNSDQVN